MKAGCARGARAHAEVVENAYRLPEPAGQVTGRSGEPARSNREERAAPRRLAFMLFSSLGDDQIFAEGVKRGSYLRTENAARLT